MVQYCGYQRPGFLDGVDAGYVKYCGLTAKQARFTLLRCNVAATTDEPGYKDIGLYNTSSIASDILW
jgi:hypothetical protein